MHKERIKESAPRSITLPSASARCTILPATASAKVRALRGQPTHRAGTKKQDFAHEAKSIWLLDVGTELCQI